MSRISREFSAVQLEMKLDDICLEVGKEWRVVPTVSLTSFAKEVAVRLSQELDEGAAKPFITFGDGSKAFIDSWTGGAHELGHFGGITLRFVDADGTQKVRAYQALDSSVPSRLQVLLDDAEREGLKVRVWLEPQQPLAMGNHAMRAEVRPARYPVVETHAEKFAGVYKAAAGVVEASRDLEDARGAYRLMALETMCGHVQDGSDTRVAIFQDDATLEWIVKVGEKSYSGRTLEKAVDAAIHKELGL